jgi:glycerophosphoryl diester phosphodiesterase
VKNRLPFLLIVLCGCGCQPHVPTIVAHRGASRDAPENTLAAFRLAWEQGADAIEGDFYVSKDGRLVCIHDGTTKRTAGVELAVAESTVAALKELEVGAFKGAKWRGEKIPTIEEVLALVPPNKTVLIEMKCGKEGVAPLAATLRTAQLAPKQTTVIAFNAEVIAETKRRIPEIKAFWLTGYEKDKATGDWTPTLASVLATLEQCGADGLDTQANLEVVDEAFVAALRERDLEFHAWTVNDLEKATRLKELGVDSITTDRPRYLREGLSRNSKSDAR